MCRTWAPMKVRLRFSRQKRIIWYELMVTVMKVLTWSCLQAPVRSSDLNLPRSPQTRAAVSVTWASDAIEFPGEESALSRMPWAEGQGMKYFSLRSEKRSENLEYQAIYGMSRLIRFAFLESDDETSCIEMLVLQNDKRMGTKRHGHRLTSNSRFTVAPVVPACEFAMNFTRILCSRDRRGFR